LSSYSGGHRCRSTRRTTSPSGTRASPSSTPSSIRTPTPRVRTPTPDAPTDNGKRGEVVGWVGWGGGEDGDESNLTKPNHRQTAWLPPHPLGLGRDHSHCLLVFKCLGGGGLLIGDGGGHENTHLCPNSPFRQGCMISSKTILRISAFCQTNGRNDETFIQANKCGPSRTNKVSPHP